MVNLKLHTKLALLLIFSGFAITNITSLAGELKPLSLPQANQPNTETEKIILDNGLTTLLKIVPKSDIVSIVALIKSSREKENKFLGSGITHLTEHMLFKDNPEDPKSEIAKQVSLLGGEIDGSTSYDWTEYSITLPKENVIPALELFHRFLMKPEFRKEDLEKEKQVVIKEINLRGDNPSNVMWNKLMETAFLKHPYRYPVIGYEDLLKKIDLEDLKEYYNSLYTPANIILSLAGDFDKNRIKQKIDELFAKDNIGPISSGCLIEESIQISTRKTAYQMKSTNLGFGALAYKSVSIYDNDMYALDALASILGGGESSRLNQVLKENLKIVYAIDSIDYTPMHPGLFIITFRSETENLERAFTAILNEIENVKKSGISEEELEKAKQSVKSSFLFSQESCEYLAKLNAQFEATVGNPDFNRQYLEKIEKLSRKDIQEAAKRYLKTTSLNIVSLMPSAKENVSAKPQEAATIKPEIKKYTLDGDLKVLLRQDKQLPIVDINIIFLGGLLSQTQKNNGISYLTSQLILKGTKTKSAYDIARIFESWGASVSTFSNNNSFGISVKILKERLPECLKLISEIITTPAFEPKEIEKERTVILGQIKEQKEDIFTIASLLLRKELYPGHPYSFNPLGTPQTLKNLTQKDIIDFYAKQVNKPNMVISVFGDIDSQNTIELISNYFAGLNSKSTSTISNNKPRPLDRNNTAFEILEKEQSIFMLGFRTCNNRNPDRYALDVISQVLSSLDGRLFKNIRKDLGIAYTLGGYNSELLEDGHFVFYVATTKENLKKAQEKIWQEIIALKKDSITKEELDRAKKSLIGKMKISLETNSGLAMHSSFDELYGLGFDNYKNFERNINSLTRERIKQILNKYFTDNYVEIFVSPSSFLLEKPGNKFSFKKLFEP